MDDISALDRADRYASIAEEATEHGHWRKAFDAHLKAAEQYLLVMSTTTSEEALKTLRLLQANHSQKARDLQNRLAAQQLHAASSSSRLPRAPPPPPPHHVHSPRHANTAPPQSAPTQAPPSSSYTITNACDNHAISSPTSSAISSTANHYTNNSTEASYLFLTHPKDLDTESIDPFNRFWDAVETLVQKTVTAPVAFATAPLGLDSINSGDGGNSGTNTKHTSLSSSYTSNSGRPDMSDTIRTAAPIPSILNSYFVVPNTPEYYLPAPFQHATIRNNTLAYSTNDHSCSNHPFANSHAHTHGHDHQPRTQDDLRVLKTSEELRLENESLKSTVDILSRQVVTLEKAAEENAMLRSSIIQFRQDVQKEKAKQRIIKPGFGLGNAALPGALPSFSALSAFGSPAQSTVMEDREAGLMRKVAQLQEELKKSRDENEKHVAAIAKYRERWDRLKESARKRKEVVQSTSSAGNESSNTRGSPQSTHQRSASSSSASNNYPVTSPSTSRSSINGLTPQQPNSQSPCILPNPISIGTPARPAGINAMSRTPPPRDSPPLLSGFPPSKNTFSVGVTVRPFDPSVQPRANSVNVVEPSANGVTVVSSSSLQSDSARVLTLPNTTSELSHNGTKNSNSSSKRDMMASAVSTAMFYSTASGFE
ncbi:hypothetical protein SeLEV6574_g03100 [Synchytrium endobioticum]|uniref:MIT domain-containing protein n=1 Tax=Synchytrium endobioticum TaxID=286115 RepID=A0A507D5F3_9FUNG|nr:hypothetical protein SeLEV6574_g03100 [Synchytrium endobioticum]